MLFFLSRERSSSVILEAMCSRATPCIDVYVQSVGPGRRLTDGDEVEIVQVRMPVVSRLAVRSSIQAASNIVRRSRKVNYACPASYSRYCL